jgi:ATP-dependent helicase/nuclease subunit B
VDEEGRVKAQRRLDATRLLRDTIGRLLAGCPKPDATQCEALRAAVEFLRVNARCVTESDNLARMKLVADIEELVMAIGDQDDSAGINATEHLAALPRQSRFGGSGPRPGHLHVAHVLSGGHSGRGHTFIVGLDDSRFPGGGYQDPLLLDSEKARLSPDLQTSAENVRARLDAFCQLLARVRGTLALSFSCRSIADDREMFPSPVVLAAWRVISGNHEADQGDLLAKIPPPASFAPADADQCTDQAEWWLWRLCGPPVKDGVGVIARQFPHLGRGLQAVAQRAAPIFGAYDGLVPEAGKLYDPLAADGPIMSASGLQTIGRCPLAYFFERILRIKPPDEFTVDPSQWLDALQFGSLLHQVLCQFMRELVTTGKLPPVEKRDAKRLQQVLDLRIKEYRDLVPPPSESVFQMQCRRLEWAVRIFLIEEEQFCQTNRPLYLEASIGMESDGEGTPLDTAEPVLIRLSNGRQIRTRGRIDRIDQFGAPADATYSIWDYKTGGTWKYEQDPPFCQGRIIQHAVYCEMALAQLRKINRKAKIAQVGYFFPERRATGQRIAYRPEDLKDAGRIIQNLCETVHAGAFLATNEAGDCGYCDYACVCGDPKVVAVASQAKLDEPANRMLEPIRQLRSQGDGEE